MTEESIDAVKRRFLTVATGVVGGAGAVAAAWPFLSSWQPSARARALGAPVTIDISKLEPGAKLTDNWRGKPVWIVRRTPQMLENLPTLNDQLSDPNSEEQQQPEYITGVNRSLKPEILVMIGSCTHLGCSPTYKPDYPDELLGDDWKGGFFCPCHGSKFDLAGRVYKGVPAPLNLPVPPYRFANDTTVVVGEDHEGAA